MNTVGGVSAWAIIKLKEDPFSLAIFFFLESLLAVLKLCHLIGPGPDLNCQKLRFHMHTGKEESFNIMQERGRRAACNEPVRR